MKIQVDSREKDRVDEALLYYQDKGHEATVTTLDYGDYVFNDQVVFEFKLMPDYMSSLYNESLFEEATNQALLYPYHFVIIVGDLIDWCNSNWNYVRKQWNGNFRAYVQRHESAYYGSLRRLRSFTVPIEVKTVERAYLEMLLQADKCLNTVYYGGTKRKIESADVITHILGGAGGVSDKNARKIKETLEIETIEDLINKTKDDYRTVKGIGEKTSENLYNWIHPEQNIKIKE